MTTRTCKECHETKPLETGFYPIRKRGRVYYPHVCRDCRNAANRTRAADAYRNEESRRACAANRRFNALVSWPVP